VSTPCHAQLLIAQPLLLAAAAALHSSGVSFSPLCASAVFCRPSPPSSATKLAAKWHLYVTRPPPVAPGTGGTATSCAQ
jgi:hypothetical protein